MVDHGAFLFCNFFADTLMQLLQAPGKKNAKAIGVKENAYYLQQLETPHPYLLPVV